MLPGPAGSCLVSFHILWAIPSTSTVDQLSIAAFSSRFLPQMATTASNKLSCRFISNPLPLQRQKCGIPFQEWRLKLQVSRQRSIFLLRKSKCHRMRGHAQQRRGAPPDAQNAADDTGVIAGPLLTL